MAECEACGRTVVGVGSRGKLAKRMCPDCAVVVCRGCLTKMRFLDVNQLEEFVAGEGLPVDEVRPYSCVLCGGVHWSRDGTYRHTPEREAVLLLVLDRVRAGLYRLPADRHGPATL